MCFAIEPLKNLCENLAKSLLKAYTFAILCKIPQYSHYPLWGEYCRKSAKCDAFRVFFAVLSNRSCDAFSWTLCWPSAAVLVYAARVP